MSKETIETLVSELTHEEEWRRMRATAACLAGGPVAVRTLVKALEVGDAPLRAEAASMLARIKDPAAGLPLVAALNDADETVRKAAFGALEQMAGVLDGETAAGLVRYLSDSPDEDVRARVRQLLGVIPNAIAPLCDMLKHPDAVVQEMAASILEHLLDPRSADGLIDAMTFPAVRDIAVRTLKKLGVIRDRIDGSFNALRDVEGASEREEARMAVVMDLLGIGRPSVEILIEYLEDDDWVVREAAADLLGMIGDVRAVEPLMKRLQVDKDTGVKEYALKSLGLIGDPRPAQLYIEAIPIRPLRVFAMEALAKVKDVEVLRPHHELFNRLRTDRDGLVAYSAGLIADKLAALEGMQPVGQEGTEDHE
ncbi:MAG: HEAT repeat domain-containing protein [Nitrospiraceae bacterium]|nr:HEAT repeat domain-containing protein [Nitrospiraceae bacterium]